MVTLITQGHSQKQVAKTLGISRQTVIRWAKLPHIQSAISESSAAAQRGVAMQQEETYKKIAKSTSATTAELIEKFTPSAVKVVAMILAKAEAKDSDRLKAAELLARWSGIGQAANQTTNTAEQTLHLYLNALENKNNAN